MKYHIPHIALISAVFFHLKICHEKSPQKQLCVNRPNWFSRDTGHKVATQMYKVTVWWIPIKCVQGIIKGKGNCTLTLKAWYLRSNVNKTPPGFLCPSFPEIYAYNGSTADSPDTHTQDWLYSPFQGVVSPRWKTGFSFLGFFMLFSLLHVNYYFTLNNKV